MMRLRFDFLKFAIRAETESKYAGTRLRGDGHVQGIRAMRQLHRTKVRSAEPIPGFADFPDGLSAIFALVHAKANGFAVGRPGRKMRKPGAMRELAELRPIRMDGIETAAANINDLGSIRRPRGLVANGFAHAARLTALHGPQPERHLVIAPGELSDQEL